MPIHTVFDTNTNGVNTIIIEHRKLFCDLLSDLYEQSLGNNGVSIISNNDSMLNFSTSVELLQTFIPFQFNEKKLVTKIINVLEKKALHADFYNTTQAIISSLEKHIDDLSFDFNCDLEYNSLNFLAILKAIGIRIVDDGFSIAEKVLNYMDTVLEFEGEKLFITINMRNYIEDQEMELFMKSATAHNYNLLMIENVSYPKLDNEIRYTIDSDLCEF